jgi:hypothetical protein
MLARTVSGNLASSSLVMGEILDTQMQEMDERKCNLGFTTLFSLAPHGWHGHRSSVKRIKAFRAHVAPRLVLQSND